MKNKFLTETANFRQESSNIISYTKLISLIKDEEQISFITDKFNRDGEEFYIDMKNIDIAYQYVQKWGNKYEYKRVKLSNNEVSTYFLPEQNERIDANIKDMIFEINSRDGKYSGVHATAIYDTKDKFYEEWKLSAHINYLKKNGLNKELKLINQIWLKDKGQTKERVFKLLKSKDNLWYVRSISSDQYKEYGTAFTFVYTILLLNNIKDNKFSIEALNLNESKISMTISHGIERELGDVGYIKSAIHMENNDLASKSFKIEKQIVLIPKVKDANNISIQVPKRKEVNKLSVSVAHGASMPVLHQRMLSINNEFLSTEDFEKDFEKMISTKKPEGLRNVIEQKIISSKILKECQELKELFKPSQSGVIDNMAKLINLCGKAELLDIDYDMKSKLREIISDVLILKR